MKPARISLFASIACACFALTSTPHELRSATAAKARNVVLFVADDMGQDAGCYGNRVIQTPHLDALARAGTRFLDAFCTTASCSPSRSVIKTGLHNHANGQYGLAHADHNFVTRPEIKTLPIFMREAGYRTARFGRSLHVRPYPLYDFDVIVPDTSTPLTLEKRLYGRDIVTCVDDAAKFIGNADPKPFFVMIASSDSHRFGTTFEQLPGKPNTFANDHKYRHIDEVIYAPQDVIVPRFLNDNLATRAELAQYYQCVSRIDQGLGRLVEALKRTGHWNDTLVIFTSDHGAPFPGAKTNVYEPGLRVPCVIRDPTAPTAGVVSDAMVSLVDIVPTILDYTGALPPDLKLHGRSVLSLLGREHAAEWGEIYASHTFHEVTMYYPMRAIRDRRYKLIVNVAHKLDFPHASDLWKSATWQSVADLPDTARLGERTLMAYVQRPQFELYDLQRDPGEVHNLAFSTEHKQRLAEMLEKLKRFQRQTGDPWFGKWTHE